MSDALERLVPLLAEKHPVDRLSVRMVVPGADQVVMRGVWSRGPTNLVPGMRFSAAASSLPEIITTGEPVVGTGDAGSMLDSILRDEGMRSWVTVPLRSRGEVVGLFSVSSRTAGAFDVGSASLVEAVGRAIEAVLPEVVPEHAIRTRRSER